MLSSVWVHVLAAPGNNCTKQFLKWHCNCYLGTDPQNQPTEIIMPYHSCWKNPSKKKGKIVLLWRQSNYDNWAYDTCFSITDKYCIVFSFSSQKTMVCHLFKHAGISVTHYIIIKTLFCLLTDTVTKPFYRFAFGSLAGFHLEIDCFGGTHELKTFWASCLFFPFFSWKTLSSDGKIIAFIRHSWITFLGEKYVGEEKKTQSGLLYSFAKEKLFQLWATWSGPEVILRRRLDYRSPEAPFNLIFYCEDWTATDVSKWICRCFPSLTDGLSKTPFFKKMFTTSI